MSSDEQSEDGLLHFDSDVVPCCEKAVMPPRCAHVMSTAARHLLHIVPVQHNKY